MGTCISSRIWRWVLALAPGTCSSAGFLHLALELPAELQFACAKAYRQLPAKRADLLSPTSAREREDIGITTYTVSAPSANRNEKIGIAEVPSGTRIRGIYSHGDSN